jgi:uncharacterized protein (DUF983 family)
MPFMNGNTQAPPLSVGEWARFSCVAGSRAFSPGRSRRMETRIEERTMTESLPMPEAERDARRAMRRGWGRRCPNCGTGGLFDGYLRVRAACPDCGEALHHQRADDGPAYFTIIIVGHLLAPLLMFVYFEWRPEPWKMTLGFAVGCVALSLYLLPRIKGAMIGLQWAKRLHGFGAVRASADV